MVDRVLLILKTKTQYYLCLGSGLWFYQSSEWMEIVFVFKLIILNLRNLMKRWESPPWDLFN